MKTSLTLLILLVFTTACNNKQETKLSSSNEACSLEDARDNGWSVSNASAASGIRNFSDISACKVSTCESRYALNPAAQSCEPILCTLENANLDQATSVTGNLVTGCLATGCEAGYFNNQGACEALQCDPLLQYVDMNICADKEILSAQFSFTQDYTNVLNPNLVSVGTTTFAKKIGFFADASCTISQIDYLPLSDFPLWVPLPIGDGLKEIFVKYQNETKESSCLTDSIILDTTPPALNIFYPALNENIAGNSLLVQGNCTEINPESINVNVSMGLQSYSVPCQSGTFSASFDISSLTDGAYNISYSATDLAGNLLSNSTSFKKITCSAFQNTVVNQCEDKDILNAEFIFTDNYTNTLSPAINLGPTEYAQQLKIYSDDSCQVELSTFNLSTFSSSLTLPEGSDGERVISAKFFNGSKESLCLKDSITLDRVSPLISFNPLLDTKVSTNTVTISGTCTDLNEVDDFRLKLNNEAWLSASCTAGVFSETINLSSISVVSPGNKFKVTAEAKDPAGNLATKVSEELSHVKIITITMNTNNPSYGKIISMEGAISCEASTCSAEIINGESLNLSYELLFNGKFTSWGQDCLASGANGSCSLVNIQENKTIQASFEPVILLEAYDDIKSVQQDQVLYIPASELMANDRSLVNRTFSVLSVQGAVGGAVSLTSGTITFDPSVLSGDPASFTYTIRDTSGVVTTAKVNVTITALPQRQALIYSAEEFDELLAELQAAPPSAAEVFDSWGRFEERAASAETSNQRYSRYFANRAAAQANSGLPNFEALSWSFATNPDRVISTVNSAGYIGFVSPKLFDNYELSADVKSTGSDDDAIMLVLAYVRVNGVGYTLSAVRTQGGVYPDNGFGVVYNYGQDEGWEIASRNVGGVYKNPGSGTGWISRTSRIQVQRNGNLINVFASPWNSTTVSPASLITIDLNSDPRLAVFKGAQKYGFGALSQADSTYLNIRFKSNSDLDPYFLYDLGEMKVYEYIEGVGWGVSNLSFGQSLDYPREIYNPRTGKTYYIDREGNVSEIIAP